MSRKEFTKEQWRKVAPLLPPQKLKVIARLGTTGILDGLGKYGDEAACASWPTMSTTPSKMRHR